MHVLNLYLLVLIRDENLFFSHFFFSWIGVDNTNTRTCSASRPYKHLNLADALLFILFVAFAGNILGETLSVCSTEYDHFFLTFLDFDCLGYFYKHNIRLITQKTHRTQRNLLWPSTCGPYHSKMLHRILDALVIRINSINFSCVFSSLFLCFSDSRRFSTHSDLVVHWLNFVYLSV